MKSVEFDANRLGALPSASEFDISKLGGIGEPNPEIVKKINAKNNIENVFSDTRSARNRLNYVTNSKGETVIPNTDPIKKAQKEAERQEFLLTTPGSAYYDEDYTNRLNYSKDNISLNERMLVESAKNKISAGKDLNIAERNVIGKYGVDNVLGDTLKGQYDIFAVDNPYNVSRSKRFKEYAQKEMNGGTLTEVERDAIETFKLLENYKKQTATEEFKMTSDIKSNSEKLANVAARSMYNDTAYGGTIKMGNSSIKIDELPIASDKEKELHTAVNKFENQLELYTKTGLANYFVNTSDGLKTGWNIIAGQDTVSDLKDKTDTPYAIASAVLKQHFTENGERVNMMLQDTITNMAQNAIPMTAAMLTAGMGGGALLTQFVSTAAFAPSVFGGAYKEGIRKGVTDPRKLFAYATITTVAECGLEAALGASFNPAGGVLTGEIVSSLSSKFSNVFAKVALKVGGNAIGEFVEESAQSILSPLLTEVILGVDDTTFFDDPIGSLSQAAYEGLIGALSASLMGGPSNVVGAINEAGIQTCGKNYKAVVQQVGADINDIAAYFKGVSKNKNLAKLCDKVLSGDHSDLTIGEMLLAANQLSKSAAQQMYSKIGEKITSLEGGVEAVLSLYNENVANGAVYPDKISKLYQTVKSDNENNTVKDADIGQLAVEVQAYAPRSLILGQTLEKLEAKTPVLQSSANGENSALQSTTEGGIINQGGEENGQNVRDGSERTWGGSGDTEGGAGSLQTANAGIWGTRQENFGRNENRSLLHNQGNKRIEFSPEQSESLKTTAIKNEDGTPKVTYHFTSNMDFETFNEGDVGFHFGNLSQAGQRKISLVSNGKINADSGRVIQAFLNIKNPIRINTDIMTWWPTNTALKLYSMEVLTEAEAQSIMKLQNEGGYSYNSPAAVELRRILAEKGYDGIVYDNHFEGDGESYIAFYPEQVIIIDDGKPNTQADSENGPASFMPENDSNLQPVGLSGTNNGVSGNVFGANGQNLGVRHHTSKAEQEYIKRICDALGVKMQFVHITSKLMAKYGYNISEDGLPDGFYDKDSQTLYIGFTGYDPVKFVFKHELTHFGEGTESYKNFVKAVRNSQAYRDWLVEQGSFDINEDSWADIERTVRQKYIEARKGYDSTFDAGDAQAEMIADFVGKYLFNNDASALERMMSGLDYKQVETVWQHIKEFFAYLKRKLSGEKDLVWEITRLENQFNRMLSEAVQTKKATEQSGGVKFSKAEDTSLYKYIKDALAGVLPKKSFYKISERISDRLATDIEKIVGFSVKGYGNEISQTNIQHIENEHGANGRKDKSMQDHRDLARIPFVIENYEKIAEGKLSNEYKNSDGTKAKTVVLQKRINGEFYYVVEAVPDANLKTLHIVSAYKNKKDTFSDVPVSNDPRRYVQDGHQPNVSNNSISDKSNSVKNNIPENDANNSDRGLKFTFSRALNNEKIQKAEEMEKELEGEYDKRYRDMLIWEETGLIRDPSGVWVYEIDDGKMRFYPKGDRFKKRKEPRGKNLLKNYIRHKELFERYPQLNDTELVVYDFKEPGAKGAYLPEYNCIMLDKTFVETASVEEAAETIIHEIQHAAQHFDERENGANIEYWNQRLKLGTMPKNPKTGREYTPVEAYYATRGEYEARMSSERLWMDSDEKYSFFGTPHYDAENTVSTNAELVGAKPSSLKFSIPTDREYLKSAESGDNKTLQQMVDNKARAEGYTERLYHQTGADFTEFNTDNQKAGKYDWELPTGMFLKPSNDDIGLKGKRQMNLYAKQRNPLKLSDRAEAQQYWRDNVDGYDEAADKILSIDAEYQNKLEAAAQNTRNYLKKWRRDNHEVDSREIYNDTEYQRLNDLEDSIVDEWEAESDKASLEAKKLIDNYIAESDYDGVVLESDIGAMGRSTKTYIVFDSSQLKDASPVTYDDSGNVIPLSERFSGDKKDIRFSIPYRPNKNNEKSADVIDKYTEEQYNDFGWVRYNNVLDGKDVKYITQEIQKIKNGNNRGYILTQYGDYIIPLGDKYNVLVYANDNVESPHIRKVLKIDSEDQVLLDSIRSDILNANSAKLPMADDYVRRIYGPENFMEYKKQDFPPFRQYVESEGERTIGEASSGESTTRTKGRNALQQNKGTDRAGLNELAFPIPQQARENREKLNRGEIKQKEFLERTDELYGQANEEFGVLPRGENAKVPIPVPRAVADDKPTRRWSRTFIETGKLTDEMLQGMEEKILLGDFAYEVISDERATHKAVVAVSNGTAEDIWKDTVNNSVYIGKNQMAIGEQLLVEAMKNKDTKRTLELVAELSDVFTRGGQLVQAARLLKQMTGAGRLVCLQRVVKTLNKDLQQKYGDKAKMIKIDSVLAEQLVGAKTPAAVEMVYQDILRDVAEQTEVTFLDKLNAWRYFAMLANPRTHIRNIISNIVFTVPVTVKNIVGAGVEYIVIKNPELRTKSLKVDKKYNDFASQYIKSKEAKMALEGKGQLDEKGMIQELRRTFKTDWLEKATKGNSNLLEYEDMCFKSFHFKSALARYLQAQKVDLNNISEKTLNAAREYAVKEAKKATFQDVSVIANLLNNIKVPKNFENNMYARAAVTSARIAVEGVLPFKRTPINIIKRGVEYSPLGLAEKLTVGLWRVKKGEITISEFCDGLAAGLTGTGLMALGCLLASAGWAVGGFGDDEEEKFRKLNGEQEYSIMIFGKSYSIEWAAPAVFPFFVGVELMNEMSKDGIQLKDVPEVMWNLLEPITNLSMLSGVQGVIDAVKFEDGSKTIGTMVSDIGLSFAMQLWPSFFGALARTVDPTQRSWYIDKNNKYFDSFSQTAFNNFASKFPGLSYLQAPKIDAWGREVSRGNVGERVAENFISPGYYSKVEYDEVSNELKRIFVETGANVFPKTAAKSFQVDGETKQLTAAEYVIYAKAKGEFAFDYIYEFVNSNAYKGLNDAERMDVIENLYKYANAKAKAEVSDYDLTKQFKTVTNRERNGGSAIDYYVYQAIKKDK